MNDTCEHGLGLGEGCFDCRLAMPLDPPKAPAATKSRGWGGLRAQTRGGKVRVLDTATGDEALLRPMTPSELNDLHARSEPRGWRPKT